MEKITATFNFTGHYDKGGYSKSKAYVQLIINYKTKTYSILTDTGGKNFTFSESSHEYRMWRAVLEAINDAIDFANVELGLESPPPTQGN